MYFYTLKSTNHKIYCLLGYLSSVWLAVWKIIFLFFPGSQNIIVLNIKLELLSSIFCRSSKSFLLSSFCWWSLSRLSCSCSARLATQNSLSGQNTPWTAGVAKCRACASTVWGGVRPAAYVSWWPACTAASLVSMRVGAASCSCASFKDCAALAAAVLVLLGLSASYSAALARAASNAASLRACARLYLYCV